MTYPLPTSLETAMKKARLERSRKFLDALDYLTHPGRWGLYTPSNAKTDIKKN